jgi:SAM-dependent methyltransferase
MGHPMDSPMDNPMDNPRRSFDPSGLRAPMTRRLYRRAMVKGEIMLPAVPGMLDEYVRMCDNVFAGVGVRFKPEQLDRLRSALEGELAQAYAASSRSSIVITYDSPVGTSLNYVIRGEWKSIGESYDHWVAVRKPPLFGTEPDARVWALATEAADPNAYPVLDIGAGTGRNALALARRGHPVDAVEMTPKFADTLRAEARQESLDVRVIQRDVFAAADVLRSDYRLILLSEVLPDFRTVDQVRDMFHLAARCLTPGGHLVFNVFLAHEGYELDDTARELGQQTYSMIFTRDEMAGAAERLPLELIADDSVYDYEKTHLPEGAWPPTSWYAEWTSGQDVFDMPREECPIDMRWLVYRKPE